MTEEEKDEIVEMAEKLLEKINNVKDDEIDFEHAKVIWPPKEGMNYTDAMATLFDLDECEVGLTFYGEDGNTSTDELTVAFSGLGLYQDAPNYYDRRSLQKLIKDEWDLYVEEDNQDCKHGRLLKRLLDAFEEPV